MTDLNALNTLSLDTDELFQKNIEKPFRLTPFIVTFCEGKLTDIDIQKLIEMGMKIIRFRMSQYITRKDKIKLLNMINKAVQWICEKYDVSTWPIAVSIDIPNACIRTGFLSSDIESSKVFLKEQSIVELTCNQAFWNKCTKNLIFIDDSYIIESIKVGTEISIRFDEIVIICVEIVDSRTVKGKVIRGDKFGSVEHVCVRGVRHHKPELTKHDLQLIQFAIEFKLDIVTLQSVRQASTIAKVRKMFPEDNVPVLLSSICEQEGLDNLDSIITESDGIILSREFLGSEIKNKHKMTAIQLHVSAKCQKEGKPFFISGNILEETMMRGEVSPGDVADITNAVLHGTGFVLRDYKDSSYLKKTLNILDSVCKSVELLSTKCDFWRLISELKVPVNAAEASILGSVLIAKQTGAMVIILPTVSGRTAIQMSRMPTNAVILTISSNPFVAKKLQVHRGIIPIIYDKKPNRNWCTEMETRVQFAVLYGIKQKLLAYGNFYVVLKKSSPLSSFCDSVSVWPVRIKEIGNQYSKMRFTGIPITKICFYTRNVKIYYTEKLSHHF